MKPEEFYNIRNIVENKKDKLELSANARKVLGIIKKHNTGNFLDIGCGDVALSRIIANNCDIKEYHGIDISESGILEARKHKIIAVKIDVNYENLPYKDNYFDFVIAGELIEHLFDPDHLFMEAYRVLKPGGHLLLTTPNLGSWHNRLALLFGYQPHYSEVSTKYSVGKFMTTDRFDVSGHLRLFTLRALIQLLKYYKFQVVLTRSYNAGFLIDRLISNCFPSLGTGLIVLSRKESR